MKLTKRKKILLIRLFVGLIFSYFAFRLNLKVVNYEISSQKIDQPFRIVFLSDLHSSNYGKKQEELLNCIKKQKPDIILLGGDIADDKRPLDNTITVLKYISKNYPCYYVTGNHEFWTHDIEKTKKIFTDNGIKILEGNTELISIHNQTVMLSGVDDPEIGETIFYQQMDTISEEIQSDIFTIFMSHRSEYIKKYLEYPFDFILSGHAHGGQWIIPHVLNGFYAPNQGFFPEYAGGKYDFDDTTFIVSRGLSKWSTGIIPRIFNPPELVVIDIIPST